MKIGSDWELQKLLKTMFKFLQGAPTRRPLYENVPESLGYLFQICGHRWYENEKSAERAKMIMEGCRKLITYICSVKKSQPADSKNKSFQYLKSMIHDPLLPAKLKFFEIVSGKLNAFIRGFQTNKTMVPFIADTHGDLVRDFFGKII